MAERKKQPLMTDFNASVRNLVANSTDKCHAAPRERKTNECCQRESRLSVSKISLCLCNGHGIRCQTFQAHWNVDRRCCYLLAMRHRYAACQSEASFPYAWIHRQ